MSSIAFAPATASPPLEQQSTTNVTPSGSTTETTGTKSTALVNSTPSANMSGNASPQSRTTGPSTNTTSDLEPNNRWENATGASPNTTVLETLTSEDQDWYLYQIDSASRVEVSVTAGDQTNMSAFLYREGELMDSSYVFPGRSTTLTSEVDDGGSYYMLVRDEGNGTASASDYAFSFRTISTDAGSSTEQSNGGGFVRNLVLGILISLLFVAAVAAFYRYTRSEDETNMQ